MSKLKEFKNKYLKKEDLSMPLTGGVIAGVVIAGVAFCVGFVMGCRQGIIDTGKFLEQFIVKE